MDTLKIGHYIQHLRKAAGMTQKELAEKRDRPMTRKTAHKIQKTIADCL